MAKLTLKKAATDVTVYLFAQDSSKTTGEGLTGLAYNTASLTAYYVRPLGSATAITLATQTVTGAHSDGGFKEVDATNMPGVYRLDLPDAVCATGVPSAIVMLKGAANLAPVLLEIQLTDFDLNTAGVLIGATQGAITWGQQKIIANVAGEGALDIYNSGEGGYGQRNRSTLYGQYNSANGSGGIGQRNAGIDYGQENVSDYIGQNNVGDTQAVSGYDPALATATNLAALDGKVDTVDGVVDAIKAKSDLIPADPAEAGEYTAAIAAVKSVADDILVDTGTTLDGKLNTIDTNVDSILADTGTDGVKINATQGSITWGQQKIVANVAGEGALDIENTSTGGLGGVGIRAEGELAGQYNAGSHAVWNDGISTGQRNNGGSKAVEGFDSALALEATLTAIKAKTDNLPADPADDSDIDAQLAAIKAETAAILVDTGTDGVKINATQGAITWGQQKIIADADGEGALDIVNTGDGGGGVGIHTEGQFAGQFNEGTGSSSNGTYNVGIGFGLCNQGEDGQFNAGARYGLRNYGTTQAVVGHDPALALEETLTEIKGAGWTDETLTAIDVLIDAIKAKSDQLTFTVANKVDATATTDTSSTDLSSIAGDVWSYAKRTLTHPSVSAEEPEDSNTLILYRDADIAIELTDLTIPAGAKKYIFTIKDNLDSGDDQAVLQASYAIDGSEVETNTLVYINSAAAPVLTNPVTFTLTDTNITIDLTAEAAALLPRYERGYLNWDLKLVTDASVTIVLQGLAQIIGTSTRAIE